MAGRLDWSHASLDSTSVRAKHGGTTLAQTRSIAASRGPSSTWSATVVGCRSPRRSPPPTSPTWSCSPRSSTTSPGAHAVASAAHPAWQAGCRQRLRQRGQPRLAAPAWDHRADRPARDRIVDPAGAPPLAGGAHAVMAVVLAAAAGPVGSGLGAVVCVCAAGLRAHLLPAALTPSWSSSYRSCGTSRVCVKMRQSCHWSRAGSSASQARQCRGRRCSSW
jgi:hypothetical protein